MKARITEALVRNHPLPETGNELIYDDETVRSKGSEGVRGFAVRITAAGARSFILSYRIDGRERRYTFAEFPAKSVEAARKEARGLRERIKSTGYDPLRERQDDRAAPTVNDLCDRYIEEHLPTKREASASDDRAMIGQIIRPQLGREKVEKIEFTDIDRLHKKLKKTPYRANRVHALLSKMFALSMQWKWRKDNPAKGVKRHTEEKRERYLETAEIVRLTEALAAYEDQDSANIIRFLLLTGARRGEVLAAPWSQFDLDNGTWTKPAATTKQNKKHRVPLSDGAVALLKSILEAAPRDAEGKIESPLVFPGRFGQVRLDIKKQWAAIAKAAGLVDEAGKVNCRLHDLRHTYASVLVSQGLSLPIIGALLGHTQAATTHRYAHLMDDPLRQATNRVAAVVLNKPSADVHDIAEQRA